MEAGRRSNALIYLAAEQVGPHHARVTFGADVRSTGVSAIAKVVEIVREKRDRWIRDWAHCSVVGGDVAPTIETKDGTTRAWLASIVHVDAVGQCRAELSIDG